jgi:retron-type reverse transcriptase
VRGITLLKCIVKILEKMLLERLKPLLLSKLPEHQYGFRPGLSAMEQACPLIATLQHAKTNNYNVVLLFLDIKKAFDRVDRNRLTKEFIDSGVPLIYTRLIFEILHNNSITVLLNGYVSSGYIPVDGLPQGKILSPLLFNFYMRDLPSSHYRLFSFADDDVAMAVIR